MSKPGRNKRVKASHYFNRIPLEDDIEVIHARSSHLSSRNEPLDSSRSPLKGVTTWSLGNAWAPDDDEELALDDTGDQYNRELMANIFDSTTIAAVIIHEPLVVAKVSSYIHSGSCPSPWAVSQCQILAASAYTYCLLTG